MASLEYTHHYLRKYESIYSTQIRPVKTLS